MKEMAEEKEKANEKVKVKAKIKGREKGGTVKLMSSFVVLTIVLSVLAVSIATVSSEEASFTFYSTANDGTLQNSSTVYTSVHDATTGSVDVSNIYGWIGQDIFMFPETTFWIYRVGLFFDTSNLPDDCIITSATLSLYGVGDLSFVDFDITAVNGSDLEIPMNANDYGDLLDETTSGGVINTANFSTGGYNDISLNTIGLSWINKTGITKFGLRSSRDINGNEPSDLEKVWIYLYEQGSGYQPKLTVNYRETTPPASVTNLQNTTYASMYINWTWTDPGDSDFSHVMVYLDGTFKENVTKGTQFYNATGLTPGTAYTIGTHTVDEVGNINETWVNHTASTAPRYNLTISSTVGGTVTDPGEGTYIYDAGEVIDLRAVPDAGYEFVNWTGEVGTIADVNANETTITMNDNYTIKANFAQIKYDLTISSTEGGDVTEPGEGTFVYNASEVVSLRAVPDAGYRFVNWTGEVGTIADVNANETTITMNNNYTIKANFARIKYTLTISGTPGGSVTEPGEGAFTYDADTVVSLKAVPDVGWIFVNWTGEVGTIADVNANETTITMNDNYTIKANFARITYNLTISSTPGGSVTEPGEGAFTYDAGTVVSLKAVPDVGWIFVNWTGEVGTIADVNANETTITVNDNYTIKANFAEVDLVVTKITPNCDEIFANESNEVCATVKNNGTGDAGAFNVCFDIDSFSEKVRVDGLPAGGEITKCVNDTTERTAGEQVTITVTADCDTEINESDETNNENSTEETVVNNGYKGKSFAGVPSLVLLEHDKFNGSIVYTVGNSSKVELEPTNTTTTGFDIAIPEGATVRTARLYVYWYDSWYSAVHGDADLEVTFDGHSFTTPGASYTDGKGFGSYNYPKGTYAYDVTSAVSGTGTYTATIENNATNTNTVLTGQLLLVVYEDANETEMEYWITEGCDLLKADSRYCVSPEEAIANVTITGTIDVTNKSARLITVVAQGNESGTDLSFNEQVWEDVWQTPEGSSKINIDDRSVTSWLKPSDNVVDFRDTQRYSPNGTMGMQASNAILVVRTTMVIPLPDGSLPTDPDGDGLYEDLNGNGRKDFDDVVKFFTYMEWIADNEPISCFDFNGNGRIDFDDVVKLFEEI